jgi:hypothetical protein
MTTTSTVTPFKRHRERQPAIEIGVPPLATWNVSEMRDPVADDAWFKDFVADKSYGNTALSLWTHHANLRAATERFAGYVGLEWPAADGRKLIEVAIEDAATRAQRAVENREAFEGRLIGVYLYGLLSAVGEIARLDAIGHCEDGSSHRWPYLFSAPSLKEWAAAGQMRTISVHPVGRAASSDLISGLRDYMKARIANSVDLGYLAKYAPQG